MGYGRLCVCVCVCVCARRAAWSWPLKESERGGEGHDKRDCEIGRSTKSSSRPACV